MHRILWTYLYNRAWRPVYKSKHVAHDLKQISYAWRTSVLLLVLSKHIVMYSIKKLVI